MNQDITYEILRQLYLDGEAILARRLMFSKKSYNSLFLKLDKIDRPIILEINGNYVRFGTKIDTSSTIYWGDGTFTEPGKTATGHKYAEEKNYIIRIFGHTSTFIVPVNIVNVHSIGEITDLSRMFCGCENLTSAIGTNWDTTNVTKMNYMFYRCKSLTTIKTNNWNTTNVIDMAFMFCHCYSLEKNVGKNWDTSKVRNMYHTFANCTALNKNIGKNWDTSNVNNLSYMFAYCIVLNKNIGKNWNISRVKYLDGMFLGCKNLDQNIGLDWDLTLVHTYYLIFDGCAKIVPREDSSQLIKMYFDVFSE